MKKKTYKAIAIVMAIVSVLGLAACKKTEPVANNGNQEKPIENPNSDSGDDDVVDYDYYGCPNSKRVKKLNLVKK